MPIFPTPVLSFYIWVLSLLESDSENCAIKTTEDFYARALLAAFPVVTANMEGKVAPELIMADVENHAACLTETYQRNRAKY
jgi:hypothetical protein